MNPFEAIGTGSSFLKHFDALFINHLVSVKKDSQFPFFMHFYIQLFSANPKIQKKNYDLLNSFAVAKLFQKRTKTN